MSFRDNLRFIMDCKGIQTKELSRITKISENTLKSYLKTNSAEPTISKVITIAGALHVSVEYLITGCENDDYKKFTNMEFKINEELHKLSERDLKVVLALVNAMGAQNRLSR